jgi:chromosome segregation ATPase
VGGQFTVHEFDAEAPPADLGFKKQPTLKPSAALRPRHEPSLRKESLLAREKIDRLNKDKQEFQLALEKSRQAESKLQDEVNCMVAKRIEMVNNARNMKETINQKMRELSSCKAEIGKNRERELLLRSVNETKLSECNRRIKALEAEKAELLRQAQSARSQLKAETNMAEVNDRLHRMLESAQRDYKCQLEIKDEKIKSMLGRIETLQTEKEQMQGDLDVLREDKRRLIDDASRLRSERNRFEIENNILKQVDAGKEDKISSLVAERAELTSQVDDLRRIDNEHVKSISSLSSIGDKQREEIQSLKSENALLVSKCIKLQGAVEASDKTISAFQREVHEFNLALTKKHEDCAKLQSEVRRLDVSSCCSWCLTESSAH